MIITPEQREAINDILIDAFQSPKYIIRTSNIMSVIETVLPREIPDINAPVPDGEIYGRVYTDKDHLKSAKLMRDILNADEIVRKIEAIK